tara:strand:- start:232 stop:864 length:633 start_codon:yes stop_codon:yes gene_type:complete
MGNFKYGLFISPEEKEKAYKFVSNVLKKHLLAIGYLCASLKQLANAKRFVPNFEQYIFQDTMTRTRLLGFFDSYRYLKKHNIRDYLDHITAKDFMRVAIHSDMTKKITKKLNMKTIKEDTKLSWRYLRNLKLARRYAIKFEENYRSLLEYMKSNKIGYVVDIAEANPEFIKIVKTFRIRRLWGILDEYAKKIEPLYDKAKVYLSVISASA